MIPEPLKKSCLTEEKSNPRSERFREARNASHIRLVKNGLSNQLFPSSLPDISFLGLRRRCCSQSYLRKKTANVKRRPRNQHFCDIDHSFVCRLPPKQKRAARCRPFRVTMHTSPFTARSPPRSPASAVASVASAASVLS